MFNQHNRMKEFAPALGLIFGAGIALNTAILVSWNIAFAIIIGAGLGLIIGSAVYSFMKNRQKKQTNLKFQYRRDQYHFNLTLKECKKISKSDFRLQFHENLGLLGLLEILGLIACAADWYILQNGIGGVQDLVFLVSNYLVVEYEISGKDRTTVHSLAKLNM